MERRQRPAPPIGTLLFILKIILKISITIQEAYVAKSKDICPPVPGFHTLPINLMAKIWNKVPGLQTATTLGAAKSLVKKWSNTIPR